MTSEPLRVLHFLPSLDSSVGGPVRAITDLSHALVERGHQVTLLTLDRGDFAVGALKQPDRFGITEMPGQGFPGNLLRAPKIFRSLLYSHNVLHLHGAWLPANIQLSKLAAAASIPYLVSIRGMLDDWSMQHHGLRKRIYLAFAGRSWFEGAAFIHLTAQRELEQASKWLGASRTRVIPNLLNVSQYRLEDRRDPSQLGRTVLFLSRVHPKKGIETLIHAADILERDGEPIHVTVAGTGDASYVAKIRKLVESLGLAHRFAFIGHVGGEPKLKAFRQAALFVLPTQQENFGFVFFEALAAGIPVVTTPEVDLSRELQASSCVWLADRTPAAFARAISEALSNRDRLREIATKAPAWTANFVGPDTVAPAYAAMYHQAIRETDGEQRL